MVRERKCILCHIVYSSKKEMEEHMRSMLHHRELENLKGRDSNHECQVCRVTVVGLSAYAKHISSQLHKDNVDAHDKAEEKEEAEEEYLDKELIQLIKQRKERNRQAEACCANQELECDDRRSQRRREERAAYKEREAYDQSSWHHHNASQRDWKWEKDDYISPRQGKFSHSQRNLNINRHPGGPRGRSGWHQNVSGSPSNRHNYGNSGSVWHPSGRGGATLNWHHSGRGRNSTWHSEGTGNFSSWNSKSYGGNWKSNPHGANSWKFGSSGDAYSLEPIKYNKERYTWQWQEKDVIDVLPYRDRSNRTDSLDLLVINFQVRGHWILVLPSNQKTKFQETMEKVGVLPEIEYIAGPPTHPRKLQSSNHGLKRMFLKLQVKWILCLYLLLKHQVREKLVKPA
ncbi:zinc finger protein 106-like [Cygnus olor]|uniref:zinc finger protein 106-like n=1 Tax=Cygnus olor TaxID=8869 RepID=UPI001ADE2C2D|nr:zinc finger protein 106-like [Cygnus olor]